jgi:SH3-like domain-containing protein
MKKLLCLAVISVLCLAVPLSASTMQSIGKDRVNVRSKPGLGSQILFQAYLGYPIEIEKQQNNWIYVTDWKNNSSWVYKPMVSSTKTAVILVDSVNIRKGPNLKKPVVAKASQGEIYKIFGEKGGRVKIGYYLENEVVGWVRQDLVWGD